MLIDLTNSVDADKLERLRVITNENTTKYAPEFSLLTGEPKVTNYPDHVEVSYEGKCLIIDPYLWETLDNL